MVMTKREDLTKQGFCKYSEENSFFGEVSHLYLFNFLRRGWEGEMGCCGGWHLFEFEWEGERVGWRWALIQIFSSLWKKSDISRRHHWFLRAQTWISIPMTVLPIAWKFTSTNQKHYPCQIRVRSRHRKKFLGSFLDRHFEKKPAVASQNVGCFLRLKHQ